MCDIVEQWIVVIIDFIVVPKFSNPSPQILHTPVPKFSNPSPPNLTTQSPNLATPSPNFAHPSPQV